MSEFPASNLERRLFWGIIWGITGAVSAVLLNFGLPFLLIVIGRLDPKFPVQQGPYGGMGVGIVIMVGIVFSGLSGFVAGFVRAGTNAAMPILICLVLADICLTTLSTRLYAISGAIKVALIVAFITHDLHRRQPS